MSPGFPPTQPVTPHDEYAEFSSSVLPLPSQIIEAREQVERAGVASWNPEPESRWTQLPQPRERERGWTHHDWFIDYGEDGRTYQGYMPGGRQLVYSK